MIVKSCKHCTAPLPEEALIKGDEVIVCDYCSTVHYMKPEPVENPEKPKNQAKKKREQPDNFIITPLDNGIDITYPWLGRQHRGLLFFAIIWNAFIAFFTFVMIGGMMSDGGFELMVLCFLTPFYAVGIGMAWYVLAGFLNQTSIHIQRDGIATDYKPIPMLGAKSVNVKRDDIDQVYCRRRVAYSSNDVPVYVYDLHYVTSSGDDEEFLKGLETLNKAVFIEQTIERIYQIGDRPVDGEYGRRFG